MDFVLRNFDAVSKTVGFEQMGHTNVHLGEDNLVCYCCCFTDSAFTVFEVLKRR